MEGNSEPQQVEVSNERKRKAEDITPDGREFIVVLNIGGTRFETMSSTLAKYPKTMLGAMFSNDNIPVKFQKDGSVFVDQDPRHFEYILEFYRNGILLDRDSLKHINPIDPDVWKAKLVFFGLDKEEESKEEVDVDNGSTGNAITLLRIEALAERFRKTNLGKKVVQNGITQFYWEFTPRGIFSYSGVKFIPYVLIQNNKTEFCSHLSSAFDAEVTIAFWNYSKPKNNAWFGGQADAKKKGKKVRVTFHKFIV